MILEYIIYKTIFVSLLMCALILHETWKTASAADRTIKVSTISSIFLLAIYIAATAPLAW